MRRIRPFRQFGLKVLSLGLAVLLWVVVAGEQTVERGLRIPLELQQFPPGLELASDLPTAVDVRLRGTSSDLGRVGPGDVVAVLDLHNARAGRRLFHLTSEQVRVPSGVSVVQISPSTVAVSFESAASREVPVVADVEGRPAAGYIIGKTAVTPSSIEITGPESAVKTATEAITEPVSVAGARQTVVESVNIGVVDPAVRVKTPKPASVSVQILPAPIERMFRQRPVHLRNLSPSLSAQAAPTAVDVGVRGSRDALARTQPDDVTAFVDVAGLGAGQYMLSVHAESASEAGVSRIEPATIEVRITSDR